MHKPMSMFVIALAVATAAMAQTADVTGRVMRVDPGTQVIVLDNNQAFRVTPNTMLIVNGQPVAQQPASVGAQQTLYGRVTDVDRREIRIKSDNGSFEVKVPRELAAQVRKGDNVRVDLTFQR